MTVRIQSILALKCYVVAFGDLENVRVMLCVASGPRIRYWVGYRGVISPRIILTPTIHPNRVKGASGAAMRLPTMHPDGVKNGQM